MAKLYAYGDQSLGDLGLPIGDNGNGNPVIQVGVEDDWVAIAHSDNCVYALNSAGELYSAGTNTLGLLGIGTTTGTQYGFSTPILTGVARIKANATEGELQAFAQKTDGAVYAWGMNSKPLYTGVSTPNPVSTPTLIATGVGEMHNISGVYRAGAGIVRYTYLLLDDEVYRTQASGITLVSTGPYVEIAGNAGTSNATNFFLRADGVLVRADTLATIATSVATLSKQTPDLFLPFIKTDGTLWKADFYTTPGTIAVSQLGGASDWASCTACDYQQGYGITTDGALYEFSLSSGARSLVQDYSDTFVVTDVIAASSYGIVFLADETIPPTPIDFWTELNGTIQF